jgi:hypothetical protein
LELEFEEAMADGRVGRERSAGDRPALWDDEPVAVVLDDMRAHHGHLLNLVDERGRVVAGHAVGTVAAPRRLEGHDVIGREEDALGFGGPDRPPRGLPVGVWGGAGLA